jgi:ferrous iron transport protein B
MRTLTASREGETTGLVHEPAIEVVLAGNPNSGKTTLFNALTGAHQHVGNWPGKTVEWKQGRFNHDGRSIQIFDLPGTYSLSAYSLEESLARDTILDRDPDAVVVVADATNLERHLYLLVQVLELTPNVILALNMSDQADKLQFHIDRERLSEALGGIPVIRMVASRGEGLHELKQAILHLAGDDVSKREGDCAEWMNPTQGVSRLRVPYGEMIEGEIERLKDIVEESPEARSRFDARWLAAQMLEGGESVVSRLRERPGADRLFAAAEAGAARLERELADPVAIAFADRRYDLIVSLTDQVMEKPEEHEETFSEQVDRWVTHRWLGLPIFLFVMYLVFNVVVNVSAPYLDWVDQVIRGPLSKWLGAALIGLGSPDWLQALVLGGIVPGVGGVLVFVPGLVALYLFIAVLEDSGYLSRAAFVMDRFMSILGLHGKSFVPMILGFGCSVPAIYATRTLENRRERILTALLVPLMSCSARLPVYVVFSLAFFPQSANLVIFGLYSFGVLVAILVGLLLSRTLLKDRESSTFVLELPPYRWPSLRSLWFHVSHRTGHFIRNAGTVILAASVVIWLLLNLPWGAGDLRQSWFGRVSAGVAPAFEPAGFGTWEASGSLITGLVAKEVVVATMAQVHLGEPMQEALPAASTSAVEDVVQAGRGFIQATREAGGLLLRTLLPFLGGEAGQGQAEDMSGLRAELKRHFAPAAALAFLVFTLLYVPCIATLGAMRSEFGWKWAAFSAVYQTGTAWLLAVIVFQIGRLVGWA